MRRGTIFRQERTKSTMKQGATLQATIRVTGTLDKIHSLIKKHGGLLISAETASNSVSSLTSVIPPKATPKRRHNTMSKANRTAQGSRTKARWRKASRLGLTGPRALADLKAYEAKAAKKPAKKPAAKKPVKAAKKITAKEAATVTATK